MQKKRANLANLLAMKSYVDNHKELLSAEEIFLSTKNAISVKFYLGEDSSIAIKLIKIENPDETPIEYPDNLNYTNL